MILYKNKKLVIPTGINPNLHLDEGLINNQDKTVDISENGRTILQHDEGFTGLGTVTINTYVGQVKVEPLYTTEYTENGDFRILPDDGYDAIGELEITVDVQPELEAKTVDSSTNEQVVTTDKYGLSSVTVNPYTLDEKTVDSSTNPQVITSDEDGLSQVTINPYVLSPLEVDSSTASQEITGQFGTVTVNPYTLDSSSAVITENGDYAFESSADGLSRVDVSVNIDTQSYYDEGYSDGETVGIAEGIAEQKAKLDSSVFTTNGTYTREDGWNEIEVAVPGINNQNKTADSSTVQQTVTFDSGYTGLGTVTINPYFLQNKNSGVSYKYMNSDSNPGSFNVTPDAGYNGLGQVTVPYAGILSSKTFTPTTSQQSWDAYDDTDELVGLRTVVINAVTSSIDSNIAAGNIKKDVTILGVTGTYEGSGAGTPGIPYIECDGTIGSMIILNAGGWEGEYGDVRLQCDFSTANNGTFSAYDNSKPAWTSKCVVGLAGWDDGDYPAYGIGLSRTLAGTGPNTLQIFAGNTSAVGISRSTSINLSTYYTYQYNVYAYLNDDEDDDYMCNVLTKAYGDNLVSQSISLQGTWATAGRVDDSGVWAAFAWNDNKNTNGYGPAPQGTRIYEIHINQYSYYPVKIGNYGGLAKYQNNVFVENLIPATPSSVSYGVLV